MQKVCESKEHLCDDKEKNLVGYVPAEFLSNFFCIHKHLIMTTYYTKTDINQISGKAVSPIEAKSKLVTSNVK